MRWQRNLGRSDSDVEDRRGQEQDMGGGIKRLGGLPVDLKNSAPFCLLLCLWRGYYGYDSTFSAAWRLAGQEVSQTRPVRPATTSWPVHFCGTQINGRHMVADFRRAGHVSIHARHACAFTAAIPTRPAVMVSRRNGNTFTRPGRSQGLYESFLYNDVERKMGGAGAILPWAVLLRSPRN